MNFPLQKQHAPWETGTSEGLSDRLGKQMDAND